MHVIVTFVYYNFITCPSFLAHLVDNKQKINANMSLNTINI